MFNCFLESLDESQQRLTINTKLIFNNLDENSPIISFSLEKTKDINDNLITCLSVHYKDGFSDSCSIDEHAPAVNLFRVVIRANQQDTVDQHFIRYLECLLDARLPVHPLFSAIFEKPVKRVLAESLISRDLYNNSPPLYYQCSESNEEDPLVLSLIKAQFELCIDKLSTWVKKNKIEPSRGYSSANDILAVFKERIKTEYFYQQRGLIYNAIKKEFEGIILALSARDIAEAFKRQAIANTLDNLDMCPDGVCFAIDDNYQNLYKIGAKEYLAEARKEIAKQVALTLLEPFMKGNDPDIWPGNVVHYVHAFLANVEHVLAITITEDKFSPDDINPNLLDDFRELLYQQLSPAHLLSHLVQQLLPKIDGDDTEWIENELALFGMDDLGLEKQLAKASNPEILLKHTLLRRLFSTGHFDNNQRITMESYDKNYQIDFVECEPFLTQIILFDPDETTVNSIYFLEEILFLPKDAIKLDRTMLDPVHLQRIYDAANIPLTFETVQCLLDAGIPVNIMTSSPNYPAFVESLYQRDKNGNNGLIQSLSVPKFTTSSLLTLLEKTEKGQQALFSLVDKLFLLYLVFSSDSSEIHFLRLMEILLSLPKGDEFLVNLMQNNSVLIETIASCYDASTLTILLKQWISLSIVLNEERLLEKLSRNPKITDKEAVAISMIIHDHSGWIRLLYQVDDAGRNGLSNAKNPRELIKQLLKTEFGKQSLLALVLAVDKEGKNALYWSVCSKNKEYAFYLMNVLIVICCANGEFARAATQKTKQGGSVLLYLAYYFHDGGRLFITLISHLITSEKGIAALDNISGEVSEQKNIFFIAKRFQSPETFNDLIRLCNEVGVRVGTRRDSIQFLSSCSFWTTEKTQAFQALEHYGLTTHLLNRWQAPNGFDCYFLAEHKKALSVLIIDQGLNAMEAMDQIDRLNYWAVKALLTLYIKGLRGEHLREYEAIKEAPFEKEDYTCFIESIYNQGLIPSVFLAQVKNELEISHSFSL